MARTGTPGPTYSRVGILTFGEPSSPVSLYPIPTKDVLHISASAVKMRLMRARERFINLYKQEVSEE